ncbi:MAG: FtsX-like permease family protein [Cytophaga sp.]|nr:FtsX-like permease family protein [Undibacterium sp.]
MHNSVLAPRWIKILRDFWLAKARVLIMVLAIAAGVFAVTTILSAYTLLSREVNGNYLNTLPAAASIQVNNMDEEILVKLRQQAHVAAAEMRTTLKASMTLKSGTKLPVTLFVISDFKKMLVSRVMQEAGSFDPQAGEVLLEREALKFISAKVGTALQIKTNDGVQHELSITGTVHDASLAPAWQEQNVYAYITPATLQLLIDNAQLNTLKLQVSGDNGQVSFDPVLVDATVAKVANWLQQQGKQVGGISVPPPGQHPHQGQMNGVLSLLLAFSVVALLLSAVLTATMINAMLAQQVRQIGVMKAIGGGSWAIARMYLLFVCGLGLLATTIGLPTGLVAGNALANVGTQLFNIDLQSTDLPIWVYAITVLCGVAVPMLIALVPIYRATHITVREAISDVGVAGGFKPNKFVDQLLRHFSWIDRSFILALRNTFRRRGRLVMNLILLGSSGALFIGTLSVKNAWEENLHLAAQDRRYDIETILTTPSPEKSTQALIASVPGVKLVESWREQGATKARADGLTVERTYPDGGHGSLALITVPDDSQLLGLQMLAGRWFSAQLNDADSDGVVLNNAAYNYFSRPAIGSQLSITANGKNLSLKVLGVAREIMTGSHVYISQAAYRKHMSSSGESNVYRVVLEQHDAQSLIRQANLIEARLAQENIRIKLNVTESIMGAALDSHTMVLIVVLLLMSGLMAGVGALGLASAMGTSVIERTREFGIMRTIGGSASTILRNLIGEGILIGLLSTFCAMLLSLPLGLILGEINSGMNAGLTLPILFSPSASLIWIVGTVVLSILASSLPAMRAARLSVRDTLAFV